MPRPVCLFTGQWADLPLETVAAKARSFGYDGLELACWGDHFDVAAAGDAAWCKRRWELLSDHGLGIPRASGRRREQAVARGPQERRAGVLEPHLERELRA